MKIGTIGTLAGFFALAFGLVAHAETAMDKALADGAKALSGTEIAERLAGKTVTFENAASGDQWLVYYDGMNGTKLRKVGGEQVFTGFYAVSLADHVCLGNHSDKAMILRCVHAVEIGGVLHKFELDGSLRGRIVEAQDGNLT